MRYDRADLFYMSGTGNTYRVAQWMASSASSEDIQTSITPIEKARVGSTPLIGLLTPAHGFTAPWHMIRFALRMPRRKDIDAFVVSTRAGIKIGPMFLPGMEGTACYLIALILALKGYKIRGITGIDMPSNWIALHPGFSKASAEAIGARAKSRAEKFIRDICAGRRRIGGQICLLLGLLLLPVSAIYLLCGRFLLAKLFFANSKCDGCAICADNCPVSAIVMWGRKHKRPYWTFTCESCMRCMAYCPKRAVEASQSLAVGLWYLGTLPVSIYISNLLKESALFGSKVTQGVMQYAFMLGTFAVMYYVFYLLSRTPLMRAIFTYTTLTHIYRRYHEPETSLKDVSGKL